MKILVVDDSPAMQMAIISHFGPKNHIVEYASNGADGMIKFQQFKPDVVLLDIVMPVVNGTQTLRNMLGVNPAAKIIIITGAGSNSLISECMKSGAVGFITKPFKLEQVELAIKAAFDPKPKSRLIQR